VVRNTFAVRESHSVLQEKREAERKLIEQRRKEAEQRSYATLMDEEAMESNKDVAAKYESVEDMEDDFM
jgi:predicted RNA-binding protein